MDRRTFLQSLSAVAAVPAATSAGQETSGATCTERLRFAVSGPITGPVARVLAPPSGAPPLAQSPRYKGLRFTGREREYVETIGADTWYPGWAADGTLYCSYTDGGVKDSSGRDVRANSQWEQPGGLHEAWLRDLGLSSDQDRIFAPADRGTTSGNAILMGEDPFALTVKPLEPFRQVSPRYEGYYPCANLVHKGIWYYGGYYCHRWLNQHNVPITYELGGFGGFRMSRDGGASWQESPHDDQRPLFPETGRCSGGGPIRFGTPHFVDFGRDLEHSPDGYAYLAGHGTYSPDGIANWSSGDAISLGRVRPSPETMNDPAAWEFYAGGERWTRDFSRIRPIIEWPGGAGCVNITWLPVAKRYFAFACGGWADGDAGQYNLWVLESENITGPWFTVTVLWGAGGGQPYFVCMPGKFNRTHPDRIVLFYSANWRKGRSGVHESSDPVGPGGTYSLCVAEFQLI
ncbi:MAG TPA: hypothetical protein VGL22_06875 [Terracidiphilus sp.]|jgi:hypothetical protein